MTYHLGNAGKVLLYRNGGRLDEKLVATLDIGGRVRLHGLEENCTWISMLGALVGGRGRGGCVRTRDIKVMAGLDAAGIGSDAVSRGQVNGGLSVSQTRAAKPYCLGAVVFTCGGQCG